MDQWNEVPGTSSMLDVLDANLFTGVSFEPAYIEETEKNFYRGAPPSWLNFHISDQAVSNGTGTPIIKREGYVALRQKIEERRRTGTDAVKLLHQPGCGGTTLAMQVLWDLRKTFSCAVLTGSTLDIASVAKEVVQLFTAGSSDQQRTVLLLVNDEQILENLQNSIMEEITEQGIATRGPRPAVIILSCIRKDTVVEGENVVLKKVLSDEERQKFSAKQTELGNRYPDQCKQFHGFNIMLADSPQAYVTQACTVFRNVRSANKPRKTQLAAFLSLLNAYVPGSYLLESQCLNFLKPEEHTYRDVSLQDRMKPFSHLIITFQQDTTSERRVRMAHPLIAQCCTELLAQAKVDRSDTARNFLTYFCREEVPPRLLNFIKDMLTKRETKKEENTQSGTDIKDKGNKEMFSSLILDIMTVNGKTQSASVLKVASKKFSENPFFPQALARFYYIEIKDYNLAEMWAERAKKRDHKNSFIADTLGQVHKNHLNSFSPRSGNLRNQPARPRRLLRLATKAIKAFKHEEKLAEDEEGPDMNTDGMRNISNVFNTRGKFGYLQVCNILYDCLVSQNEIWKKVLTRNKPMGSALKSLGDNKLFKFNDLIKSLRDDVKRKCDFFNNYQTYSRPGMQEEDASYIKTIVSQCHRQYTEELLPGILWGIMNEFTEDENTITAADTPERYIVTILKSWTNENNTQNNSSDLMQLIKEMSHLYKRVYAKHFRSRYLCPVLYLGKGQAPGSIVPTTRDDFWLWLENEDFFNYMKQKDKIFKDLRVQQQLFKFHGRVEEYHVCVSVGNMQTQVKANMQESVWIPREVSFYLGFTIRGLVAMGIQTIKNERGHPNQDLGQWTAVEPQCTTIHGVTTYSLQSRRGQFQCSVSALRWVCKKKVRFTYQFRSWEEHTQILNMVHCKPAGPLLDITVNEGRFDEVYLPHWICIDGFQTVSDKFAVLHSDTSVWKSGNFLEQMSEVTSSHIKSLLYRFSTHGVLVRAEFPVKAHCSVLIFKTRQPILTFRIHLIPCDAALRQALEQQERDNGSNLIHKSNPEKPLQLLDSFSLTTNAKTKISPAEIQLGHEQANFFTVNSTSDHLILTLKHAGEDVWSCEI